VSTSGANDTALARPPSETAAISKMDDVYVKKKCANLEVVSEADKEAARDCFLRLQATTFWEWKSGFRLMFWNYPVDQQVTTRNGIQLWIKGRLNPWLMPHRLPRDHDDFQEVVEKLCSERKRI
jgi:hypothetical protein